MSRTKIAAIVFASLFTVLCGAGVVMRERAKVRFQAVLERVDGVRTEYESRPSARAVLYGTARDGRAFEHYGRAIELGKELGWARDLRVTYMKTPSEERLAARDAHADEVAEVMLELHRGAQARDHRIAVDWETGKGRPQLDDACYLSDLAHMVAMHELDAGRPEAAANLILDALQYARDLAEVPFLFEARDGARVLVSRELVAFGEQGGWSRLPEEQVARIEEALARIDAELETVGDSLAVHEALSLVEYGRDNEENSLDSPVLDSCVAFITLFALADAAAETELLLDFSSDYEAAHEKAPLKALERTKRRYQSRAESERDRFLLDLHAESASIRLRGLARLRLLRHALALRSGRDDAPTQDRLGYQIRSEEIDGSVRVYLHTPCYTGIELSMPLD